MVIRASVSRTTSLSGLTESLRPHNICKISIESQLKWFILPTCLVNHAPHTCSNACALAIAKRFGTDNESASTGSPPNQHLHLRTPILNIPHLVSLPPLRLMISQRRLIIHRLNRKRLGHLLWRHRRPSFLQLQIKELILKLLPARRKAYLPRHLQEEPRVSNGQTSVIALAIFRIDGRAYKVVLEVFVYRDLTLAADDAVCLEEQDARGARDLLP